MSRRGRRSTQIRQRKSGEDRDYVIHERNVTRGCCSMKNKSKKLPRESVLRSHHVRNRFYFILFFLLKKGKKDQAWVTRSKNYDFGMTKGSSVIRDGKAYLPFYFLTKRFAAEKKDAW